MKPPGALAILMEKSLSHISSPLGKLVFLSSLRDPYTGRYLHEGWVGTASPEEVHEAIREMHVHSFNELLDLDLSTLCAELKQHFESLEGAPHQVAELWLETELFREMVPARRSPVERDFFISQVRTALRAIVRLSRTTISVERDASPRQRLDQQPPPHRDK